MTKAKKTPDRRRIRHRHGGYTYLTTGELPEHRQHIKTYLTNIREGLIRDVGPEEKDLAVAQVVLIDRLISLLGICRLIEEKAKEDGIFKGMDLIPSLKQSYIAYNNTLRLTLEKLGIDKRVGGRIPSILEIAAEFDREEEAKKKASE